MGYTCKNYEIYSKNYGIYWAKILGFLCDIFGKGYGIYLEKLWDILVHCIYFAKTKGYSRQNVRIYRVNIMGYTMGYICRKLWDIFVKLWDLFRKIYEIYRAETMGYIGLRQ